MGATELTFGAAVAVVLLNVAAAVAVGFAAVATDRIVWRMAHFHHLAPPIARAERVAPVAATMGGLLAPAGMVVVLMGGGVPCATLLPWLTAPLAVWTAALAGTFLPSATSTASAGPAEAVFAGSDAGSDAGSYAGSDAGSDAGKSATSIEELWFAIGGDDDDSGDDEEEFVLGRPAPSPSPSPSPSPQALVPAPAPATAGGADQREESVYFNRMLHGTWMTGAPPVPYAWRWEVPVADRVWMYYGAVGLAHFLLLLAAYTYAGAEAHAVAGCAVSTGEGAVLAQMAALALGTAGAVVAKATGAAPEHRRVALALGGGVALGAVLASVGAPAVLIVVYAGGLSAACAFAWLSPFLGTYWRYKRRKHARRRGAAAARRGRGAVECGRQPLNTHA